ncbi:4'-phosphopantetheinyl transferase superfamily protein [Pseudoxanthomonas sp. SGNA-20]|nr:4'-phosphopantetheinyl transferase superfamily protein [Pseudoxanthomonas sp. SGNA-20]
MHARIARDAAMAEAWRFGPVQVHALPYAPGQRGEPQVHATLARWLQRAPEEPLPLQRDAHGRPRLLAPYDDFDAGWSHSGERLLLAFGREVVLGVDLEHFRPRPRALELARRFFAPAEAEWLQALPAELREPEFVRLWCAKEAVLKAHGRGLAFGLHRLEFRAGDPGAPLRLHACDPGLGAAGDWQLHEWIPQDGYHAALAWRPRD